MTGESYVIKKRRTLYYLNLYFRKELYEESISVCEQIISAAEVWSDILSAFGKNKTLLRQQQNGYSAQLQLSSDSLLQKDQLFIGKKQLGIGVNRFPVAILV